VRALIDPPPAVNWFPEIRGLFRVAGSGNCAMVTRTLDLQVTPQRLVNPLNRVLRRTVRGLQRNPRYANAEPSARSRPTPGASSD
jgi:hypothetical protein